MGKYIVKRLLLIIPTLFLILLTNFIIVQAAPGGPVEQKYPKLKQNKNRAPPKPSCQRPLIKAVAVYRQTWSRLSKNNMALINTRPSGFGSC